MAPNLSSVVAQLTRGGRSVVSRRNFSTSPSSNGNGVEISSPKELIGPFKLFGWFIVEGLSMAGGYGAGYMVYGGGSASEIEKMHKKR